MGNPYYTADLPLTMTGASPSAPSTVAGTEATGLLLYGLARFDAIKIEASLVGHTGGTLDVYLQVSHNYNPINPSEPSVEWVDYCHFAQLAAGAAALTWNVDPALTNTIVAVGKNTTPALAAGVCAGGFWGDAMRVLFVAGAGSNAGTTQTIKIVGKQRNVRP